MTRNARYECPGTEAQDRSAYSPGLDGVLAGETALCHVDEGEGGLRYRGYAVSDLADQATFEAVAYFLMGIPRELYTAIFVCSRMAGWCAHVIEQQDNNRLIRPRAVYRGPARMEYVPLDRCR